MTPTLAAIGLTTKGRRARKEAAARKAERREAVWDEYDVVGDAAEAEYERVLAPAWAEYERAREAARAEYERVVGPARAERDRKLRAIEAEK